MFTLTPTKARGARSRAMPGTYMEPMQEMTFDELDGFMPDSGMNGAFMADLLSAMLAHEQCGRHLYRTCAERTENPMLKSQYEHFGEETEEHVRILHELIEACGGDPLYVSPQARLVHGMDTAVVESTYRLTGSVDMMCAEMAMLDAVFLAESIDHANWATLVHLTEQLPDGEIRQRFSDAVRQVEDQEDEHLAWAKNTKRELVMLQAQSTTMSVVATKAEDVLARIRGWFDGSR
jgi:rubrerythrin